MHSNQAHFVTIPKVSANQSVPLVETLNLGGTKIGIQYDTGCQLSLISRSALSTILNGFNLTQAEDVVKVALNLQAIPLAKRGPFNNIIDWPTFKVKQIEEFRSIDIFGRDVNQTFNLLPGYESVQEIAEDLSSKIKTLQANLDIMENFHNKENLHSVALTQSLVQNNMNSLPMEVRPSFNDQFSKFRKQCPDNVRPPATFLFLT